MRVLDSERPRAPGVRSLTRGLIGVQPLTPPPLTEVHRGYPNCWVKGFRVFIHANVIRYGLALIPELC